MTSQRRACLGGAYRLLMETYSVEEVERVVLALYSGQDVAAANEWLTRFVAAPAAWEISLGMLGASPHLQVRFFAANALHQKVVKGDAEQLPPDAQEHLLGSLLAALHSEHCGQQEILTKLSLALVALGLFFTKEDGKLKAMLLDNPAFMALRPRAALEFFFLLPQEWEATSKKGMTRSAETKALQQLSLLLPQVVSLIQSLITSAEDQDMLLRCLQALAGWCKFGISVSTLRTLSFYPFIKELMRSPSLCKGACELFEAAIKTSSYPAEPDETLLEITDDLVALQPLYLEAKAQRNDAFCEGLALLARALVQRNATLMCSGRGSTLQLANLSLEMVGHPHKGISETAMEYWDEVELVEMTDRHDSLRGPIFHLLIEVLATRCAPYPQGFTEWDDCEEDEEDFHMFRRRIDEALLNCCVCLRAEALDILCRLLSASGSKWEIVEGILYSISCIGGELVTLDQTEHRQRVCASVSQLLSNYILPDAIPVSPMSAAHLAALKVIQNYSKCLPHNVSLVQPCLQFIIGRLGDAQTAQGAAKAFEAVCSQASHASVASLMRDPAVVQAIVQQVSAHIAAMKSVVGHSLVESLSRLLSNVEREHMLSILQLLVSPFVTRLRELVGGEPGGFVRANLIADVAACISLLGASVRFLECHRAVGAADSQHPVVLVLQSSWEALDASITKFPGDPTVAESLCDLYIKGIKQAKEAAAVLVPALLTSLVNLYRTTRSPKCLEVAGTSVELFGSSEASVGTFQVLVQELNAVSFEAASQTGGLDAVPDLLEAHFTMLTRYLIYCPQGLLASPSLVTVLDLAKAGVSLREKEPLKAVLAFLQQVVNAKSPLYENFVAPWFATNGQALVEALVLALAETAPQDVTRMRMPVVLYTLNARFGQVYQEWLRHAVNTCKFSNDAIDQEVKDQFLKANTNVEHNKGRFQALVQDFADICRRNQTTDALLGFIM